MSNNIIIASTSVEAAAVEAAVADGLIPANGIYKNDESLKFKKASLRRGKWTTEEEYYANRLIYEFKLGLLPLTDGTTLRTFLSKLLNCDPMRISKKFVGQNCIGKQVFRRRQQDLEKLTNEQIEQSRKELAELERKFLERVAQTNRSKSSGNGAKSLKDGKIDYEDEHGNTILAPWMIPPDEAAQQFVKTSIKNNLDMSVALSQQQQNGAVLIDPRSQQQQQQQQQTHAQFQHHPYGYIQYNTTGPAYTNDPRFISAPNRTSGDNIQHRNEGKNNSSVNKGYYQADNLQQQQHQQLSYQQYMQQMQQYHPYNIFNQTHSAVPNERNLMHSSDLSLPRVTSFDVLSSIAHLNESQSMESLSSSAYKNLNWGSVGTGLGNLELPHSGSQDEFNLLGNTASSYMLGELAVWPSFSNLNFMASQSMEDMRVVSSSNHSNVMEVEENKVLTHHTEVDTTSSMATTNHGNNNRQQQQQENNNLKNTTHFSNHQHTAASNNKMIGKDTVAVNISNNNQHTIQRHNQPQHHVLGVSDELVDVGLSIDDNLDNCKVEIGSHTSYINKSLANSTKIKTPIVDLHRQSPGDITYSSTSSAAATTCIKSETSDEAQISSIPKNASVDDFWMLVNMGDLPQPEQDVLSSKLWSDQQALGGKQEQQQTLLATVASSAAVVGSSSITTGHNTLLNPTSIDSNRITSSVNTTSAVDNVSVIPIETINRNNVLNDQVDNNKMLKMNEASLSNHTTINNDGIIINSEEIPTILIKREIGQNSIELRDEDTFNKRSKT